MSDTANVVDQDVPSTPVQASSSLKSQLQARRASLQKRDTFDVPVSGFDNLYGEYRPLSLKENITIGERHEDKDTYDQVVYITADSLVTGCVRLFSKDDDGAEVDMGRWGVPFAKEYFDIDDPNIDTARKAILTIFSGLEEFLLEHGVKYKEQSKAVSEKVDEKLAGESEAVTSI
jgi:hypothetical protein